MITRQLTETEYIQYLNHQPDTIYPVSYYKFRNSEFIYLFVYNSQYLRQKKLNRILNKNRDIKMFNEGICQLIDIYKPDPYKIIIKPIAELLKMKLFKSMKKYDENKFE